MSDKKGGDQQPEIDVLLRNLTSQPGVEGYLAYNTEGIPLSWTTSGFIKPGAPASTNPIPPNIVHHAALARDLTAKVEQSCKRLFGEEGDLTLLRLHTKTNEILIAPSDVANLMVVQKAHSAEMLPFLKVAEAAQLQAADEARKTRSDNSRRR